MVTWDTSSKNGYVTVATGEATYHVVRQLMNIGWIFAFWIKSREPVGVDISNPDAVVQAMKDYPQSFIRMHTSSDKRDHIYFLIQTSEQRNLPRTYAIQVYSDPLKKLITGFLEE